MLNKNSVTIKPMIVPTNTSIKLCILASIRLCITRNNKIKHSIVKFIFEDHKAIAVVIEDAIAACPLGIPPFNGVYLGEKDFITNTIIIVITDAIIAMCIGYCRILSTPISNPVLTLSKNIKYPIISEIKEATNTPPAATSLIILILGW